MGTRVDVCVRERARFQNHWAFPTSLMPTVFMTRTNGIHRGRAGDQGLVQKLDQAEGLGDDPTGVG